jgi:omega-6 fatty acid desaturase (delta-12 desaturase)
MDIVSNGPAEPDVSRWHEIVARYAKSDLGRSLWQVVNTLVPYFALWYLMLRSVEISYWITLLLAIPTAGFMVRTFILFHDLYPLLPLAPRTRHPSCHLQRP